MVKRREQSLRKAQSGFYGCVDRGLRDFPAGEIEVVVLDVVKQLSLDGVLCAVPVLAGQLETYAVRSTSQLTSCSLWIDLI